MEEVGGPVHEEVGDPRGGFVDVDEGIIDFAALLRADGGYGIIYRVGSLLLFISVWD